MKIRRFEAENRQEAMKQVKAVLGPEALILSSRSIRNPSQPQQSIFEIVAAMDSDPAPDFPKRPPRAPSRMRGYSQEERLKSPSPNRILEKLLACGLSPDWVNPLIRELKTLFRKGKTVPTGEKIQDYLVRRLADGVEVADPQPDRRAGLGPGRSHRGGENDHHGQAGRLFQFKAGPKKSCC